MSVAILIPLMRPHRIALVVQSIVDSTQSYSIVVVATGECADAARSLPVTLIEDDGGTYPVRINKAFHACTEPYVFLGADDLSFRAGWFESAMIKMNEVNGVVGINDLHNMAGVHFLVSRYYINECGGTGDGTPGVVLCEEFSHQYCDDELRHVAQYRNRWAFAKEAVVEHLHPGAGKAPSDPIYVMGNAAGAHDREVFMRRRHMWGE